MDAIIIAMTNVSSLLKPSQFRGNSIKINSLGHNTAVSTIHQPNHTIVVRNQFTIVSMSFSRFRSKID